mmetsp:Transcript_45850/g.106575  ORF Transcript_45850/g.106575 Transcript_45850/m.106575 type:complete len:156 (-) Transcript_45850:86-553(-)
MGNVCAERVSSDTGAEIAATDERSEHVTSQPPSYDTDAMPAKEAKQAKEPEVGESVTPKAKGDGGGRRGLEVVFTKPDGQDISVVFKHKPLGMDFRTGGYPIMIQNVKGIALNAGVKCGWTIKNINGAEASLPSGSFDQTLSMLRKGLDALPILP